jgi:hypothetical protein
MVVHSLLALTALFTCLSVGTAKSQVWVQYGQVGKMRLTWPGGDYGCSIGFAPLREFCDKGHIGHWAVCYEARTSGWTFPECRGAAAWCTYKAAKTPPTQAGPAIATTIYSCGCVDGDSNCAERP